MTKHSTQLRLVVPTPPETIVVPATGRAYVELIAPPMIAADVTCPDCPNCGAEVFTCPNGAPTLCDDCSTCDDCGRLWQACRCDIPADESDTCEYCGAFWTKCRCYACDE